jgi:hypothetical protein
VRKRGRSKSDEVISTFGCRATPPANRYWLSPRPLVISSLCELATTLQNEIGQTSFHVPKMLQQKSGITLLRITYFTDFTYQVCRVLAV